MSFEFFIGRRYLRTKQKNAFISLITLLSIAGVTVGVMALIVVIAVMAGFENDLKQRILGVESHIVVTRKSGNMAHYKTIVSQIAGLEGVTAATPYVETRVMLRSDIGMTGAVLKGVEPDSAGKVITRIRSLPLDKALDRQQHPGPSQWAARRNDAPAAGLILGRSLARSVGAGRGDTVYVILPGGLLTPVGFMPSMKRCVVTDIFTAGMHEFDGTLAFIHLAAAQKMCRMGDTVSGVEVRVDDIDSADRIAASISDQLGEAFDVKDWMQMNQTLFSALKLEKSVMFVILTLIIFVAAFNIASALIMLVMKKKKDIGILMAMGATRRNIRRIFVFNGMVIGAAGTLTGGALGLLLCTLLEKYQFVELPGDVYYITTLPVLLDSFDAFLIAAAALLICFLATLYPAHQAANVDPVEAIRYG